MLARIALGLNVHKGNFSGSASMSSVEKKSV